VPGGRGAYSCGRIPRLYYDVLQIVIANGDQARAKIFTEKAYTVRVILKAKIARNRLD